MVAKGLQANKTLRVLKIGRNPLQSAGACYLLKAVQKNPSSALHELHLDDIVFDKQCEQELNTVLSQKPDFMCSWDVSIKGGRVAKGTRKPEVMPINHNMIKEILLKLCTQNELFGNENKANDYTQHFIYDRPNSLQGQFKIFSYLIQFHNHAQCPQYFLFGVPRVL